MRKWWAWLGIIWRRERARAPSMRNIAAATIRIGVLERSIGPLCRYRGHRLGLDARKAVEDFGAAAKGMKVEILGGDHQNKPDIGLSIARQWFDVDKVDAIADVPTSSVALAVNELIRDKNKVFLAVGPATSDLTGKGVLAEHRALDLRHLGAGERHRQRDRQARRRHLVLPHRRLRLRLCARARHRSGRA